MVQDPHWRKAKVHLIAIVFQHIILAIRGLSIGINVLGMTINNLLCADDIVLLTDSVENLQALVTNIHTVSRRFGFTINKGKTGPNDY